TGDTTASRPLFTPVTRQVTPVRVGGAAAEKTMLPVSIFILRNSVSPRSTYVTTCCRSRTKMSACESGGQATSVAAPSCKLSCGRFKVYVPVTRLQSAWMASRPSGSSCSVYLLGSLTTTVVSSLYSERCHCHTPPVIGAADVVPGTGGSCTG